MLHWMTHGGDIKTPAEAVWAAFASLLVAVILGLALKTTTLSEPRTLRHTSPLVVLVAAYVVTDSSVPLAEFLAVASGLTSSAMLVAAHRHHRRR